MVLGSAILVFLTLAVPVFPLIAAPDQAAGWTGTGLLPPGAHERSTARRSRCTSSAPCTTDAEQETGPVFATEEDPRRTPVGVWLRRYNLDELPQLINVVLGDMSLVGPRPERPPFVQQFRERIPQYMLRHRVKSGITGWAQVNGWRGNTSIEKRIEYDLYYIENWSLLLDIKILILTLFRGFGQKHAY